MRNAFGFSRRRGQSAGKPFLSVITRCHPHRPTMLQANRHSLNMQTCHDWEQLFLIDHHGVGVESANHAIADNAHRVEGDYVLILDDDDKLTSDDTVQALKNAAAGQPDLIVFKADHDRLGILPMTDVWQARPQKARIGSCDFVTRRDMFKLCAYAWRVESCGDYEFLQAVWDRNPDVVWLDEVLAGVQRISFGAGE